MSNAEQLFNKIEKLPLHKLLQLCASAVETKMEEKRLNALLMLLETKLQSRRISAQLGLK